MLKGSSEYNQRQSIAELSEKLNRSKPKKLSPEKKISFPKQLLTQVTLDPNNKSQLFYRHDEELTNNRKMIKLGWKVVDLEMHQIDLALYCLSMLQTEVSFPLKFYAANQDNQSKIGNQIYNQIWVEVAIYQSTKQEHQSLESAVYKSFTQEIIPKVKKFIGQYMSWSYMISPEYEDTKVIKRFKKEVVEPIVAFLSKFRPLTLVP